jgi:hypothetical protein
MTHAFTVKEADLDLGYVTVEVTLPDSSKSDLTADLYGVVGGDDATEAEIVNGLRQLVEGYVLQLFPPPRPRPAAVLDMVGRTYDEEVV